MHTYELYINDRLCDLSDDSNVTLLYQSPIFAELDAIQSNRSYEISLPLTARNRSIFENADRVDVFGRLPYTKIPARLYMDGVALFETGFAVITSIDEGINIALTWGNVDNFQPLFDEDLSELDFGEEGVLEWNTSTNLTVKSPIPDIGFLKCVFYPDAEDPFADIHYVHPSIRVSRILQAIEERQGITIENKERLCKDSDGSDLFVPLTRKEQGYVIEPHPDPTCTINRLSYLVVDIDITTYRMADDGKSYKCVFDCQGKDYLYIATWYNPSFRIIDFDTNEIIFETPIGQYSTWKIDVKQSNNIGINIDVGTLSAANFYIAFYPPTYWNYKVNDSQLGSYVVSNVGQFAVAANLPDMSQGEFINQLMKMSGLFAYPDPEAVDTIKLLSVDDIVNGDVVDWSRRVVAVYPEDVARAEVSEFSNDDFAQRNSLDYDNDDDVEIPTVGYINIDDKTLEKEKELVELDFSASMNKSLTDSETIAGVMYEASYDCAVVPIYERRDGADDTEPDYQDVNPRILSLAAYGLVSPVSDLRPYLKFPSCLRFGGETGIVARRYASYIKILQDYRMVTVQMRLSPVELSTFSFKNKIHLDCFGQDFALYSIETSDTDICEVKLIRLTD